MLPALLLALLGVTLTLPGAQALTCEQQTLSAVRGVHQLPLQWAAKEETCESGWGCQDTVLLIENGVQVTVVVSKGCTQAEDQEAGLTQHRARPGLSVVSYSHVCRQGDLCNNLNNTLPVWKGPSSAAAPALGRVRCPACLSTDYCPEDGPALPCPVGLTHCYNGVVQLNGEDSSTSVRVQGCTDQAGCNLLNGTQQVGSLSTSEICDLKDFRICHEANMLYLPSEPTREPMEWIASESQKCGAGELCQETLLLIEAGDKSAMMGSKGCIRSPAKDAQSVSIHSGPPGVLVASYTRFCSSSWCNNANSSSVLLRALPGSEHPAPGVLQCPTCVELNSSCSSAEAMMCPAGRTHCYKGSLDVSRGRLSTTVGVQGCVANSSSSLLDNIQSIGAFSVLESLDPENPKEEPHQQSGAAPALYLTWVVGLGLALALWWGGGALSSLLTPSLWFLSSAGPPNPTFFPTL